MSSHCLPAGLLTLARVEPGATVEIRGTVGPDSGRCPLADGSIVQVLGRAGSTVRVRLPDGCVLPVDARVAALVRVEPASVLLPGGAV